MTSGIHTTAFRRLEYKTQVFVNHEGDYYRTRLTHTIEVAQIGRTVARALNANEDLTEAICLAHDIEHPPFGHSGEATLARLMRKYGGFDHNKQAMRIVTHQDKRRLSLYHQLGKQDYDNPSLYHLVLNMSKLSFEKALNLVVNLVES